MGKSRYTPLVVFAMLIAFGALAMQMWTEQPDEVVYDVSTMQVVFPSFNDKKPSSQLTRKPSDLPNEPEEESDDEAASEESPEGTLKLNQIGGKGWYCYLPQDEWHKISASEYHGPNGVVLHVDSSFAKNMKISPASMAGKVDSTTYTARAYANSLQGRYHDYLSTEQSLCRLAFGEDKSSLYGMQSFLQHENGTQLWSWAFLDGIKASGTLAAYTKMLELTFEIPDGSDFSKENAEKIIRSVRRNSK